MKNFNWIDANLNFHATIDGVKVRRFMIIKIHANDNSKESTYFWHV